MPRTKTKKTEKEEKPKKVTKRKIVKEKEKPAPEVKAEQPEKYYEAVGRRKTSIARVRLFTRGEKLFLVNEKPLENYFPMLDLQKTVKDPLELMNVRDKFKVLTKVKGGGIPSQAEAIRLGIARALVLFNANFKKRLKKAGFLKRDPRMRERKKFGLKRARRAPQWQKR